MALKKYALGKISIGKAATLAKLSVAGFMKLLQKGKYLYNYFLASLEEDFRKATHKK